MPELSIWNVVEVDDDFAGALLDQILHEFQQTLAGIAMVSAMHGT